MNNPVFTSAFIKCRHYNFTVFLCSQHFKRIPKVCRLQASYLCFFAVSNTEAECLAEEFAPPQMKKDQFMRLINDALTVQQYSFLTINMRCPWETRFRRGLANVINLDQYRTQGTLNTPSSSPGRVHRRVLHQHDDKIDPLADRCEVCVARRSHTLEDP